MTVKRVGLPGGFQVLHHAAAEALAGRYMEATTPEEHRQASAFRRRHSALAFLAGRALLRAAVGRHLGIQPARIEFARGCEWCGDPGHGRPWVVAAGDVPEVSLTRCGATAAVCLAGSRVGLDASLEVAGWQEIAGTEVFSEADRGWIRLGDPSGRTLALWVTKEAIGKLSGLGLLHAGAIRAEPQEDGWGSAWDAAGRACSLSSVTIPGAADAALATYGPTGPISVEALPVDWL